MKRRVEKFGGEKNCSFLAVTGCFSVPPDTGHERKVEEHGPCVRITWPAVAGRVAAARVQRYTGTKRGPGIRPWFRNARGNRGKRKTRAKNRARLSCTGTNFLLLSCARFVNPIVPKSPSRDYNFKITINFNRANKTEIVTGLRIIKNFWISYS